MPQTKTPTAATAIHTATPLERVTDDELRTLRTFRAAFLKAEQERAFAERTANDYAAILAAKYRLMTGEQVNGDGTITRVSQDVAESGDK